MESFILDYNYNQKCSWKLPYIIGSIVNALKAFLYRLVISIQYEEDSRLNIGLFIKNYYYDGVDSKHQM